MRIRLLFIALAMAWLPLHFALAQQPGFKAYTDTSNALIGNQIKLTLEATSLSGAQVVWPTLTDSVGGMEIISKSDIDSVTDAQNNLLLRQVFHITSFDSGYYVIPPLAFSYNLPGETTTQFKETESMLITYVTMEVDTTLEIKGIKGPMSAPFPWRDYIPHAVVALALILLAWLVYRQLKKKKNILAPVIRQAPAESPHILALRALQQTEKAQLWQQGQIKLYYSEVSDIIRTYIERQYRFMAMEQTTGEIMDAFALHYHDPQPRQLLLELLQTADLVKFAKYLPASPQHSMCMEQAIRFVNLTKPAGENQPTTEGGTA